MLETIEMAHQTIVLSQLFCYLNKYVLLGLFIYLCLFEAEKHGMLLYICIGNTTLTKRKYSFQTYFSYALQTCSLDIYCICFYFVMLFLFSSPLFRWRTQSFPHFGAGAPCNPFFPANDADKVLDVKCTGSFYFEIFLQYFLVYVLLLFSLVLVD